MSASASIATPVRGRWTKRKTLGYCVLDCKLLLLPIHKGGDHWVLVSVDLARGTASYLDSLHGEDRKALVRSLRLAPESTRRLCCRGARFERFSAVLNHGPTPSFAAEACSIGLCVLAASPFTRVPALSAPTPPHHRRQDNLARYLEDEAAARRRPGAARADALRRLFPRQGVPRQQNGFDCGVFAMMFAERLVRADRPWSALGAPLLTRSGAGIRRRREKAQLCAAAACRAAVQCILLRGLSSSP